MESTDNTSEKLIKAWIDEFSWLVYYDKKLYCMVCLEYGDESTVFINGYRQPFKKCEISRH